MIFEHNTLQNCCRIYYMFFQVKHKRGFDRLLSSCVIKKSCNLIKKRLQFRCFPVNTAKFLTTPVSKNIGERLLLHNCTSANGCFSNCVWLLCDVIHYNQFFYKQLVYKQPALGWQIAKQLSRLNHLSLRNNKNYRLKKSWVFPL